MLIDIEPCHIYLRSFKEQGGLTEGDIVSIDRAQQREKDCVANKHGFQYSVMVDDEEGNYSHDQDLKLIGTAIEGQGVALARLVYESSLARFAETLLASMRPNALTSDQDHVYLNIATDDRLLWADENLRQIKSIKRIFLETVQNPDPISPQQDGDRHSSRFWIPLRSIDPTGARIYSCSLLTATWYLHRLGVEGFVDQAQPRPNELLNILPRKYLKTEGIALDILNLSSRTRIRKARKKINYVFV